MNTEQEIEMMKRQLGALQERFDHHRHEGVDTQSISSAAGGSFIYVPMMMYYTLPQTANNFVGSHWIAPVACTVTNIVETHQQAAAGALTLDVRKNNTTLLASQFDLNGVGGDVITTGTLTATIANRSFAIGDRLTWGVSGSVGAIQGVCVTVTFSVP